MSGEQPYTGPERRRDDLSIQAEQLGLDVSNLNRSVVELTNYGHRNRFLIRWNIAATIIILMLTAVVTIVAVQVTENRQNAKLVCQIGNESRAAQVRLWGYVLDASSANPELTPAQKTLIAEFRIYIGQVFAQRDCNDLSPHVVTPTPPSLPTNPPTPVTPPPTR